MEATIIFCLAAEYSGSFYKNNEYVNVFLDTYKGITHSSLDTFKEITTKYYDNKDNAKVALRVYALLYGYKKVVIRAKYSFRIKSSGNYRYKAWSASGLAVKNKP